jgi:NAD(P)-dependent dehydrogenase (short-subunit alcohol dehydrogenase family)
MLAIGAAAAVLAAPIVVRRLRRLDLDGRVALITGGSRGLGLLIAEEMGRQGARVSILARGPEELQAAEHRLRSEGIEVLALQADVRDRDEVTRAVERTADHWGRLDVVVNNAGVITVGPLSQMRIEDYENELATHFWGPLYVIEAALPHLRRAGDARLVNISSIGGKLSIPHLSAYSASKAALVGLSTALRNELAAEGIKVTTVCPHLMRTGSYLHARFKGDPEKEFSWFAVSASLPVITTSARRAARMIVNALREGRPDLTFHPAAKAAARVNAMAPNLTSRLLGAVSRVLPDAPADQTTATPGWAHPTAWAPSFLTRLGDRAAEENLELLGGAERYDPARRGGNGGSPPGRGVPPRPTMPWGSSR